VLKLELLASCATPHANITSLAQEHRETRALRCKADQRTMHANHCHTNRTLPSFPRARHARARHAPGELRRCETVSCESFDCATKRQPGAAVRCGRGEHFFFFFFSSAFTKKKEGKPCRYNDVGVLPLGGCAVAAWTPSACRCSFACAAVRCAAAWQRACCGCGAVLALGG
jgi:hypothetical protein